MIQLHKNLYDYETNVQIYMYLYFLKSFILIIDNSILNYTSFTEFHTNVDILTFKMKLIYFEMSYSLLAILVWYFNIFESL